MSRMTRKLRLLVVAMAVGSMMLLGSASTAHAGDDPAGIGGCVTPLVCF